MNLIKVFCSFFILILSINLIACTESNIEDEGTYNSISEDINGYSFETLTGDIDITWGAINDDSVRIGLPIGFTKNASVGTIAAWNVTIIYSRVIDGIRMRSVNNSGAVGDVIAGGIGYNNVTYMFVGKSNYFYFIVDVYENYTSSLITTSTTTRIPNIIIEEWGTINYASNIILPRNYHQVVTAPEQTIDWIIRLNSTVPMDGIRLTSLDDSVASGEITEGGIGYNFATFRVISKAERLNCLIEKFQNGTYTTEQPTTTNFPTTSPLITTTTVLTTQNPEVGEIKEWGKIDSDTKLEEKRFQNYPQPSVIAEKNETLSITGTILGMRLKSLNYTSGLWELIAGGLNESFVTFSFKGDGPGKPYDFNIEIFGNSASTINFSLLVVTLSSIVFALFK